jgi:hypothetical protein
MSCAVVVNSTFVMANTNVALLVSWNAQRFTLSNVLMLRIHVQPYMYVARVFNVFVVRACVIVCTVRTEGRIAFSVQ